MSFWSKTLPLRIIDHLLIIQLSILEFQWFIKVISLFYFLGAQWTKSTALWSIYHDGLISKYLASTRILNWFCYNWISHRQLNILLMRKCILFIHFQFSILLILILRLFYISCWTFELGFSGFAIISATKVKIICCRSTFVCLNYILKNIFEVWHFCIVGIHMCRLSVIPLWALVHIKWQLTLLHSWSSWNSRLLEDHDWTHAISIVGSCNTWWNFAHARMNGSISALPIIIIFHNMM